MSATGGYLAFTSSSSLLPSDQNQRRDIYVVELASGLVTLETATFAGTSSKGDSWAPDISADGRWLVFLSVAGSLTSDALPAGVPRVYVRDRQARTTAFLSEAEANPVMSDDGAVVVFESTRPCGGTSDDLRSRPPQLCLVDRNGGGAIQVSVNNRGEAREGRSMTPSVDAAGRRVAFTSLADLTSPPDPKDRNDVADVYARDLVTQTTRLVSRGRDGGAANGASYHPGLSADGRYIAFTSEASNLGGSRGTRVPQIYLHDTVTGSTKLISMRAGGGPGSAPSTRPVVSHDGTRIAFQSLAPDLVRCSRSRHGGRDTNLLWDVFLHDVRTASTALISGDDGDAVGGELVAIDGEGHVVAYASRHPRNDEDLGDEFDLFITRVASPPARRPATHTASYAPVAPSTGPRR